MTRRIDGVDFTVDERIWGHRLYDEQLPHLAVLEFLCVLGANAAIPCTGTGMTRTASHNAYTVRSLLLNTC